MIGERALCDSNRSAFRSEHSAELRPPARFNDDEELVQPPLQFSPTGFENLPFTHGRLEAQRRAL